MLSSASWQASSASGVNGSTPRQTFRVRGRTAASSELSRAVGSPATLLTTMAATAPASCALRIFSEKVQAPREIRAIDPVRLPGAGARVTPSIPWPVAT